MILTKEGLMSEFHDSSPDGVARLFNNYLTCLDKRSVPDRQRRWYVRRIEEFIKAQNGRKIKRLSPADVTA